MRIPVFVRAVFASLILGALVAACHDPGSRNPTSPTIPTITSVDISGPASVAPGESGQFVANVHMSDGTVKTAGTGAVWRVEPGIVQVSQTGVVTAGQTPGERIVGVSVTMGPVTRSASRSILVLPNGTFRVVGSVTEADAPNTRVVGARVEVVSGDSTVTDGGGQYRLYGVPASADIQVSDVAYATEVRHVTLSGHSTENFQLQTNGPRLGIGGNFTLAIDVTDSCPGSLPLAASLRHRTYDASVTQNRGAIDVRLTEPRFSLGANGRGNRFNGQTRGSGATFTLDVYDYYYSFYYSYTRKVYPSVVEMLPDRTMLVAAGVVTTSGTPSGQSGSLSGALVQYDSRFPAPASQILGACSGAIQFALIAR